MRAKHPWMRFWPLSKSGRSCRSFSQVPKRTQAWPNINRQPQPAKFCHVSWTHKLTCPCPILSWTHKLLRADPLALVGRSAVKFAPSMRTYPTSAGKGCRRQGFKHQPPTARACPLASCCIPKQDPPSMHANMEVRAMLPARLCLAHILGMVPQRLRPLCSRPQDM
jgi:hypothetical protein